MNENKKSRLVTWYNQKKQRSRSVTTGRRRSFTDTSQLGQHYQHQPVLDDVDQQQGLASSSSSSSRFRGWGRSQSTGRTRAGSQREQQHQQRPVREQSVQHLNQQSQNNQLLQANPSQQDVLATPAAAILRDEYTAKLAHPRQQQQSTSSSSATGGGVPPMSAARGGRPTTATPIATPAPPHPIIMNKARRHTPSIIPPLFSPPEHYPRPSLQDQLSQLPSQLLPQQGQLQREISELDDISHWGDESTIASVMVNGKDPSPNSVLLEELPTSPSCSSSAEGSGRDHFMIHNDHLLFRQISERNVVDMLPKSFNTVRRTRPKNPISHSRFQSRKPGVQLPGEYFRSYGFSDDPEAAKPKIRRRDSSSDGLENRSIAGGSYFSSQSRSSACNIASSVSSRSYAFSISSGGSSHASVMTRSTQGSVHSTQSAPPNLWEVDRQLEKTTSQRNFEADTDLYKLAAVPLSPSAKSCSGVDDGGGGLSDSQSMLTTRNSTTISTFTTSRIPRGQSSWMNESKGVPNKVSISFRRLTLRSQVRDLEDCLDESPSMAPMEKKHPPAPPLHEDVQRVAIQFSTNMTPTTTALNGGLLRKSSSKKVTSSGNAPDGKDKKKKKKKARTVSM